MKRTLKITAIVAALCAVLAVSAYAASFEHCADAMNGLGLFKGTQNGYELDRAPTRAEAATMLVRLLGAEEEALALTYTAPYTDVADWAKPYVQYLHDNGLTKGTSVTTFGYSDKCTAQQYATFLLRALGYSDSDGGDFTYVQVMDFAKEKGIVDRVNCNEESFLRDHVAAMSYTALATAPKSGEADLLTKLVADGAVADAKGLDRLFANYREYTEVAELFDSEAKLSLDAKFDLVSKVDGAEYMTMDYDMSIASDIDSEAIDESKIAYLGTVNAEIFRNGSPDDGMTINVPVSCYYTDGYMYINAAGQKAKLAMSYTEAFDEIGANLKSNTNPICLLKSITVTTAADGTTTYILECVPDTANSVISAVEPDQIAAYSAFNMTVKVKDERLISISGDADMTAEVEGQTMDLEITYEMTNIKTGADVTVTLPQDLDTYPEE